MQRVFNLVIAAHVLAYTSFFSIILVIVGGRKVYAIDVVFAFLVIGVLVALTSSKPSDVWGRQHSTKVIALLTGWGLFELARGIPSFGLSAFGESRLLVLPALFFFFVVATYRQRSDLKKFIAFAGLVVCLMPLVRGALFYLLGGRAAFIDQFSGSSILSAQASFRFIQAGEAALVSSVAVGLLMFAAQEDARRRRHGLMLLATSLLIVIAIVQVRAAWVSAAVGMVLGSILVRRFFRYAAVSVAVAVAALAIAGPVGSRLGTSTGAEDKNHPGAITQGARPPAGVTQRGRGPDAATRPGFQDSITYSAAFIRDPAADVTAAWRLVLWRQALAAAREHPVIGQGLGGYWVNVGPNGAPVNQMPHNGYLAVLVKLGGVGLALFLMGATLWSMELVRFIRHEPDPYYRLLGKTVAVTVVMSATFAFFYDFTVAFWVLLGVGTVLVRGQSSAGPV